jgi:hypothetical protein
MRATSLHFRQLGEVRKYVAGDSFFTALEALSNDEAVLGIVKQIDLHFALAKAYADIGRTEDEFRRLLAGNRLKRSRINYDETTALDEIDRVQQVLPNSCAARGVPASRLRSRFSSSECRDQEQRLSNRFWPVTPKCSEPEN